MGLLDELFPSRKTNRLLEVIVANMAELEARLIAMKEQNEKARAENARLLQALRDQIAAAGGTTPGVDAALDALGVSIQGEDDENPDEPPAP